MSRWKTVFGGEWVWVSYLNKRFAASGICARCRRASCAAGWHSRKSGKFRCRRCFDALAADARREQ